WSSFMLRTWASRTGPAINFSCAQQSRHRCLLAGLEDQDALVHVSLEVLGQPPLTGTDLVEADGAAFAIVGEDHVEPARIARARNFRPYAPQTVTTSVRRCGARRCSHR